MVFARAARHPGYGGTGYWADPGFCSRRAPRAARHPGCGRAGYWVDPGVLRAPRAGRHAGCCCYLADPGFLRVPCDIPVMGEPCIGRIRGFGAGRAPMRRATSRLWANRVLGGSGVLRAPRAVRHATSRLWANRVVGGSVVFARAARHPGYGGTGYWADPGFCSRRAPRAARHPGCGRAGYWVDPGVLRAPRAGRHAGCCCYLADPGSLRVPCDIPVMGEPCIGRIRGFGAGRAPMRRATSRLWANRVLGGSAVLRAPRAVRRATSQLWANRVLGGSGVFAPGARRATSRLWANRVFGGSGAFARAARRATSRLLANRVLGGSGVFARTARRAPREIQVIGEPAMRRDRGFCARRVPRDIPVMSEPGIGWIRGFCARRATSRLSPNRVLGGSGVFARAARHPGYGRAGYWADLGFLRAPRDIPVMSEPGIGWIRGFCARRATYRLWPNQVLGGSGVFARAARHPGYGRTGYWADPGFLRARRDIPVMGEPGTGRIRGFCARCATSRLWGNRVLGGSEVFARAARHPGYGRTGNVADPGFLRAPRAAHRATSRLWANQVLGGSGVFARAARHPGYGRTGYWADPGFLHVPRDIPVMGEPGIGRIRGCCARRAPRTARHPGYGRTGCWGDLGFLRAPRDILVMGEPGIGRNRGFCARRAPRDIPVMGERGIWRILGFCAHRAPCAARHPGYGRTGYWADPGFLPAPRTARRAPRAARHPSYGRTRYWADPGFLRAPRAARHPGYGRTGYWADPGFLRAPRAVRRASSRLWGNRVLGVSGIFRARRAPRDIPVIGEPAIRPIRGLCARRATSRLWANRVLGGSRVFAHVARLPGYGRTRYWADPGFLRAPRDIPVMGEPGIGRIRGFCARRAPVRRATSRLWANRVFGGSRVFAHVARLSGYGRTGYWADPGFLRAPRAAPHPGYGRTGYWADRGFCARRATSGLWANRVLRRSGVFAHAARHPSYEPTGYWADLGFLRARRAARRATSRLWAKRQLGRSGVFARRATSLLWANQVLGGSGVFARAAQHPGYGGTGYWAYPGFLRALRAARHSGYGRTGYWADPGFLRTPRARAPRDMPVMGEPGIGWIKGFCARRATSRLWANRVLGGSGVLARAARRATSRLWANRVLRGSGVFAHAARHPGYGPTGYWADPGFLRARRAARRATSRLWANRQLGRSEDFARRPPRDIPVIGEPGIGRIRGFCARRAPRDMPVMGEPGIGRVRGFCACRATFRLWANRVLGGSGVFACAARRATSRFWANRVLGGSGVFARAARHPGYGRTGYWGDPGFLRAPRAARHAGYGRTGYWADPGFLRTSRDFPVMGEPGIGWIRGFCARRATSRLWLNRVLGGSGVFARAARRAPRDIPVIGEPGIGRIRGLCACLATFRLWANRQLVGSGVFSRAPRAARHPSYGRTRYWADPGFLRVPRDIPVMEQLGIGRIRGFGACRVLRAARYPGYGRTRLLGESGVFARVARHPGYGRTGCWADPGFLHAPRAARRTARGIPVMGEPGIGQIRGFCACRATSRLWGNRVLGGSGVFSRAARRATTRLWANQVLGGSGVFARAARHPGYGRTKYWADPGFLRALRARAPRDVAVTSEPGIGWIRGFCARRATSRLWANRVLGGSGVFARAARHPGYE